MRKSISKLIGWLPVVLCLFGGAALLGQKSKPQQKPSGKPISSDTLGDAVMEDKLVIVEAYLKKGGNPNALLHGNTLLTLASSNGNLDTMRALLKGGAKVNLACTDGDTPLLRAARHLYRTGMESLELLIASGANVNQTFPKGSSPLMMVASPASLRYESDYADATKLFLKHGAKVNARNQMGYTALKIAKNAGALQIVKILTAAGAK